MAWCHPWHGHHVWKLFMRRPDEWEADITQNKSGDYLISTVETGIFSAWVTARAGPPSTNSRSIQCRSYHSPQNIESCHSQVFSVTLPSRVTLLQQHHWRCWSSPTALSENHQVGLVIIDLHLCINLHALPLLAAHTVSCVTVKSLGIALPGLDKLIAPWSLWRIFGAPDPSLPFAITH